jgi:hypothetical protein
VLSFNYCFTCLVTRVTGAHCSGLLDSCRGRERGGAMECVFRGVKPLSAFVSDQLCTNFALCMRHANLCIRTASVRDQCAREFGKSTPRDDLANNAHRRDTEQVPAKL